MHATGKLSLLGRWQSLTIWRVRTILLATLQTELLIVATDNFTVGLPRELVVGRLRGSKAVCRDGPRRRELMVLLLRLGWWQVWTARGGLCVRIGALSPLLRNETRAGRGSVTESGCGLLCLSALRVLECA